MPENGAMRYEASEGTINEDIKPLTNLISIPRVEDDDKEKRVNTEPK